jgi:hypothetical protein
MTPNSKGLLSLKVEDKALDEICRFKLTNVFEDAESRQKHDQLKV